MWNYEKRLEYPINIKRTDAAMAKAIISQFGGPDGETGAAMRYLSQRFAMPYRPVMGVLTDVGIEASNRNLPGVSRQTKSENQIIYICDLILGLLFLGCPGKLAERFGEEVRRDRSNSSQSFKKQLHRKPHPS